MLSFVSYPQKSHTNPTDSLQPRNAKLTSLHFQKGINQIPQYSCFKVKKKQMIYSFLLEFAPVTLIQEIPTPHFKLIKN